ncbi:hypothetical protein [Ferrovibrio terrae]|uniref:hypothetical protein n=1 Tax=Ferrovibrio terrae TaxID=2594003 RepID=UPI003137ADEA
MLGPLGILNASLIELGVGTITAWGEDSPTAEAARTIYPMVRDALLSSYTWSFATVDEDPVPVPTSEGAPKRFAIPNACLRVVTLTAGEDNRIKVPYRLRKPRHIVIRASAIEPDTITFIERVDESLWPSYFEQTMVIGVAARLCIPLTENDARRAALSTVLKNELSGARLIDAQSSTPQALEGVGDLIAVRS